MAQEAPSLAMQVLERFLQIDPLTGFLVIVSAIVIWTKVRSTVVFHSEWISNHERDSKQRDIIINELKVSNAKLGQIAEQNSHRIERVENIQDRMIRPIGGSE